MKINVPEKYADLYLKALAERKKNLEAKIQDFRREIEEIDHHISSLTSLPIFQEYPPGNAIPRNNTSYHSEWSWTRKIVYYQDLRQKIFTSSEVIDYIIEKEQYRNKAKVRSSISAALSNKNRTGSYIKFMDPVSGTAYYGPAQWFINGEQPLPNYLPDKLRRRLSDM